MKTTMTMKVIKLAACMGLFIMLTTTESWAQEEKLTISGFSDLTFNATLGSPAAQDDLDIFELLGGEDELVEKSRRVSIPGFNMIFTRPIDDRLIFQAEIVNSFEDGELEIELLRSYIDYKINPKFNLQAGKFLSAIGYLNQNQRFYGYLNYSVQHRELVEKEFGFIPLSTVGLKAYGSFEMGGTSALSYQLAYGGMRGIVPESGDVLSEFELGEEDESNSPGVSGLLEYLTYAGETEIIIGASVYSVGRILGFYIEDGEEVPYGEEADELEEDGLLVREEMNLSEVGFAPYLRIDGPKFQFLGEYHSTTFTDEIGNLDESSYGYSAYSLQVVYKTRIADKPFYPYIRFDGAEVAEEGSHPYYGLELEGGEELANSYIPSSQEIIFGFAWDVMTNNRIKAEYGRFLEGPFPIHAFRLSTAFAF